MTPAAFDQLLDRRIDLTRKVLGGKAGEYATGEDRLHNFARAAGITGGTPAEACVGFMVKHLVSVLDMVRDDKTDPSRVTRARVDEKIGDAVNYLILLEAILTRS